MSIEEHYRRAVRIVARVERMQPDDIISPSGWRARRARRAACYLTRVVAGVPVKRLAAAANLPRTTLRSALAAIEDGRDDPDFDDLISRMEEAYHASVAA